ncbi:hypothetical protein ACP4OV_025964 [Aristida adscensionis]
MFQSSLLFIVTRGTAEIDQLFACFLDPSDYSFYLYRITHSISACLSILGTPVATATFVLPANAAAPAAPYGTVRAVEAENRHGRPDLDQPTRTKRPEQDAMAVVPTSRRRRRRLRLLAVLGAAIAASSLLAAASAAALVGEACSASSAGGGCGAGLRCTSCVPPPGTGPAACARTTPLDPKTHGTGLPFNKYAWLTTHNSFAMVGTKSPIGSAIISPPNQEDTVTAQLRNGVRGLMLDTYDFNNEVWLCHSFNGKCLAFTAYQRAVTVLKEILAFLESNPSEVVTVFVEDYTAPGSLGKVFAAAGLTKYILPAAKMPKNGGDWPLLKDMISQNHRLVVFTSKQGRESSDGIPYEWAYVVENQYGSEGLAEGKCGNRAESKAMSSTAQSLVLMNFFTTNPSQSWACGNNSSPLVNKLKTCYDASAKRWPNFIAVDFYMRSTGGGAPLATDVANGRLQCGCDSISYCKRTVRVVLHVAVVAWCIGCASEEYTGVVSGASASSCASPEFELITVSWAGGGGVRAGEELTVTGTGNSHACKDECTVGGGSKDIAAVGNHAGQELGGDGDDADADEFTWETRRCLCHKLSGIP